MKNRIYFETEKENKIDKKTSEIMYVIAMGLSTLLILFIGYSFAEIIRDYDPNSLPHSNTLGPGFRACCVGVLGLLICWIGVVCFNIKKRVIQISDVIEENQLVNKKLKCIKTYLSFRDYERSCEKDGCETQNYDIEIPNFTKLDGDQQENIINYLHRTKDLNYRLDDLKNNKPFMTISFLMNAITFRIDLEEYGAYVLVNEEKKRR